MKRRQFMALAGGTLLALRLNSARSQSQTPRIGVLIPGSAAASAHLFEAFRLGLREQGYAEGRTVTLEVRYGEANMERVDALARELVDLKVNVIVAVTDAGIKAVKAATRNIPIVMAISTDPIGTGFIASLARPGGNITGLTFNSTEMTGKRLEYLKEVIPALTRIAFLWTPSIPGNVLDHQQLLNAGRTMNIDVRSVPMQSPGELEAALSQVANERVDALIVAGVNPVIFIHRKRIIEFAAERRLPMMCYVKEWVAEGALAAYGPDNPDLFRRAAGYVDKILKGANPGVLPVQEPAKFELTVNLKTAKALGLTIPQSILVRADEVIE